MPLKDVRNGRSTQGLEHGMPDETARTTRAHERREQILDAASTCFAKHGFHNASIAEISNAAGMSPGHIYHFFTNKEEIVGGIVERIAARWMETLASFPPESETAETLAERVVAGMRERSDVEFASLWLEVLAEAARNATIAETVTGLDARIRAAVREHIIFIRKARGIKSDASIDAIADVSMALFEGLSNRSVLNPGLDLDAIRPLMLLATAAIIDA